MNLNKVKIEYSFNEIITRVINLKDEIDNHEGEIKNKNNDYISLNLIDFSEQLECLLMIICETRDLLIKDEE